MNRMQRQELLHIEESLNNSIHNLEQQLVSRIHPKKPIQPASDSAIANQMLAILCDIDLAIKKLAE